MSQQLVKKGANGKHENVMPRSWIEAIKDKNTGQALVEILQGFNMYFLPYNGNTSDTRCLVPTMLRKKGLWITYVKYDGNVYTEWYAADEIDDKSWGDSSNWRIGNNTLVGDITISANGNWVINGTETEFKAVGEKGNTPLLRVANNRLQVSYDLGDTYIDVTNNPVYTKFRWLATTGDTQANNVGRIQASVDEGKTWTNMSNDFTNNLHIKKYIGVNESLPTSGIAEGTIYAKGPYYAEDDTLNDNPIYRLWVYAWKGNTLAWQDNGEFQSIAAGIVQETGDSETKVMSQKVVTEKLAELGSEVEQEVDELNYMVVRNAQFDTSNATIAMTSSDHDIVVFFKVKKDTKVILSALRTSAAKFSYGYSTSTPIVGTEIKDVEEVQAETAPISISLKVPYDGYFVCSMYDSKFSNFAVKTSLENNIFTAESLAKGDYNLSSRFGTYSLLQKNVGDSVGIADNSISQVACEVDCDTGDIFEIETYQGVLSTRYAFLDKNRTILSVGRYNGVAACRVVAPDNSVLIVVQSASNTDYNKAYIRKYSKNEASIYTSIKEEIQDKETYLKNGIDNNAKKISREVFDDLPSQLGTFPITRVSVGDIVQEISTSTSQIAVEVPCREGDVFAVKTYQGADLVRSVFIDDSRKVISLNKGNGWVDSVVVAPSNATKLLVQSSNIYDGYDVRFMSPNESLMFKTLKEEDYSHAAITEEFLVGTNGSNPYANYQLSKSDSSVHDVQYTFNHEGWFTCKEGTSKCKLIIIVGGANATATWSRDYYNLANIFTEMGYAVLGVQGWSYNWKNAYSLTSCMPSGNWMATEAVKKAYKYVIDKYDFVDKEGCFLYGESQGGCVCENVAETTQLPILATVLDSPVVSLEYHQFVNRYNVDSAVQSRLDSYYHFNGEFDKLKVIGCDPFTRNITEDIEMNVTGSGYTDIHIDVNNVAAKKYRNCNSPVMILVGNGDTVLAEDVQLAYAKALQNAGNPVCVKYYQGLTGSKHGCIENSDTVTIKGYETGNVLNDILDFLKLCGGH